MESIKLEPEEIDPKVLTRYQHKIITALYPDSEMQGGLDLDKVDRILRRLNNRIKIHYYIEVALFAIETCSKFADEYGGDFGEEFFIFFVELFEDAVKTIVELGLNAQYQKQLSVIADTAFEGYGYADQLQDIMEIHFGR